jgi:hypothetical protein
MGLRENKYILKDGDDGRIQKKKLPSSPSYAGAREKFRT